MRIVIISDTHGRHSELGTLSGDVLIHCGDFCDGYNNDGHVIPQIDQWFGRQDFERILCIGGNHDFIAQSRRSAGEPVFQNAIYLEDDVYRFNDVTFYGTPWLPDLDGWAYFLSDDQRQSKWSLIPRDTDVLITHTPPFGVLDKPRSGRSIGCPFLAAEISHLQPKLHCFGHVHASFGQCVRSMTTFVNAAMVDSQYEIRRSPVLVNL